MSRSSRPVAHASLRTLVSSSALVSMFAMLAMFAIGASGCSSDEMRYRHDHSSPPPDCSEQTTCGACTPIVGCGWCDYGDGTGACTEGPSRCDGSTFRWNWEPEACPASPVDSGSDAGSDASNVDGATSPDAADDVRVVTDSGRDEVSTDSGREEVSTDSGRDEVSTDASDAAADASADGSSSETSACAVPTDLGSPGCAVTTGGTACSGDVYTVGCHGDPGAVPSPNGALKCEATSIGASAGAQYYCCPCGH